MTKICLHGMNFYAYHGYYEYERKAGNHFILDVEINLLNDSDFQDKKIGSTINYENIYRICKREMAVKQILLETVVRNIARALKEELENVETVFTRICKLNPQLGGDVDKAVIEFKL